MGETITLTASDGHQLSAWRAVPAGKPKGGIVVVQEAFGVNHHIRDVTERFAKLGYLAIAPAMFDRYERNFETGYAREDMKRVMAIFPVLNWDYTTLDLEAARTAVASAGKVGVTGFCFGGSASWVGATRLGFNAAVGYYGSHIIQFVKESPKCPTILHFGSKDGLIPAETVAEIREAHPEVPVYVYDADHGFSCDERAAFDKVAYDAAWKRTTDFFAEHVG
jgi:carboxymethylenebutenolidase